MDPNEEVSASEQYKRDHFTLNWLSMREKQLKIAILYEHLRRSVPLIEDSKKLSSKIVKLKLELGEVQNDKALQEVMWSQGQLTNTLQTIMSCVPKSAKTRKKSQYSEEQAKHIKDLLKLKKFLSRRMSNKQKEIVSLEEGLEISRIGLQNNKQLEGNKIKSLFCSTKEDFERLDENTKMKVSCKKLALRSQLLAKIISSLSHMTKVSNKSCMLPLLDGCQQVMESRLTDNKEIHSLILTIHDTHI